MMRRNTHLLRDLPVLALDSRHDGDPTAFLGVRDLGLHVKGDDCLLHAPRGLRVDLVAHQLEPAVGWDEGDDPLRRVLEVPHARVKPFVVQN